MLMVGVLEAETVKFALGRASDASIRRRGTSAPRSSGARFITPPKDLPARFAGYLRDPDGYLIEVRQPR
jgi:hypothetical protein